MNGLPRDFHELVTLYGRVIEDVAPGAVLEVAHHLWYRGILGEYRVPTIVTRNQVIAYLGISLRTWKVTSHRRPHVMPAPVEGTFWARASTYRYEEAKQCFERREMIFPKTRKTGFLRSRLPGLLDFIFVEATKLADEMRENGYIFDVPQYLPQTTTELMAQYSPTVLQVVRYKMHYGKLSTQDAANDIWLKILGTGLLSKFMRSMAKRLPPLLTTDEALDYLGVDAPEWLAMMETFEGAPNPVKGSSSRLDAIYDTKDICALDESGYFVKRGLRFLPESCVTKAGLDRYLKTTAQRTLKNIFRREDRHCNREDLLQDGSIIQDNCRIRSCRREDSGQVWEETLASDYVPAENLMDIKRRFHEEYPGKAWPWEDDRVGGDEITTESRTVRKRHRLTQKA